MKKRISAFLVAIIFFMSSSVNAFACEESQSNVYTLKILFGDDYTYYEDDEDVEKLLSALYLCSMQSNNQGENKLKTLNADNWRGGPKLAELNVNNDELFECSHKAWGHDSKKNKKKQDTRKDVLRRTTVKVLDFGWFNETFKRKSGKIDSFSALLYYSHILADYLADDPEDTEVSAQGVDVPAYYGEAYKELNGNRAKFTSKQKKETQSYKEYSDLDSLGRSRGGISCIGPETLENVTNRGYLKNPTGWIEGNVYYCDEGVTTRELYNRCHLIAHSLGGVDTLYNLVTGTRYMNEAMEWKERAVADYIKKTGNHVIYRATPVYKGENAIANGVQVEAYSVEDEGKGIQFNVYFYNVQPGIDIDYMNGNSELADKTVNKNKKEKAKAIIPFAIINPDDDNPDLMYEISKQLEVLFAEQKEKEVYKEMMNKLRTTADSARIKGDAKKGKEYLEMKKIQYEYVETLSTYVPILLKNETFFKGII